MNLNLLGIVFLLSFLIARYEPIHSQSLIASANTLISRSRLIYTDVDYLNVDSKTTIFSPQKVFASELIRLYQGYVSPARGTVCPMYPSCSRYAYEAFAQHNPLRAWFMVSDRLFRCGADAEQYSMVLVGSSYRRFDGITEVYNDPRYGGNGRDIGRKASGFRKDSVGVDNHKLLQNSESYYNSDSAMYDFAEWLKKRGDYQSAIIEYLRLEYYHPLSRYLSNGRKSRCQCYYLSGSFKEYIECGERLLNSSMPLADRSEVLLLIGASHFRSGSYVKAIETLNAIPNEGCLNNEENCEKATILQGLSAAYMRKWQDAERYFLKVPDNSQFRAQALHSAHLCSKIHLSGRRNPTMAGLLAIVPGLGYMYSGYNQTALSAFVINGAFIWGAAEAFKQNRPGLGTTLAIIGFGWYAGNIYGSITSAKRSNEKQERELLIKLEVGFEF